MMSWCRLRSPLWCQTSDYELSECEKSILSYIKRDHKIFFVEFKSLENKLIRIRTLVLLSPQNSNQLSHPLVLLHGFGSGLCLWSLNIESLANNRNVFAIDLLGFGRSSRINFSFDNEVIVKQYIHCLNEWRKQIQLKEFILLGHSFGSFLAINYALNHSNCVKHLILCEGWGLSKAPDPSIPSNPYNYFPFWGKLLSLFAQKFPPLAIIRAIGPFGLQLIRKFLPRMPSKFLPVVEDKELIIKYIYHSNAQTPSGEIAFQRLSSSPIYLFAKNPILNRMSQIDDNIGIDLIFGSKSVFDRSVGKQIEYMRENSFVKTHTIINAGHNVHIDAYLQFNSLVNAICKSVDNH
jgi:pimeloyl-ACP methyl ester carboxylesterase